MDLGKAIELGWDTICGVHGFISVNNPTLNNNIGKFNLSHVWDRVLLNTKGLTLNKQCNNNIN